MRFGRLSVGFSTTAPNWYLRCQLETVIISALVFIDVCLIGIRMYSIDKGLEEYACSGLLTFNVVIKL